MQLEVEAELAVAALAGDPLSGVELPLRREAEVAGRHVDHAVAELELVEELLLPLQTQVLGVLLLDRRVDEHLGTLSNQCTRKMPRCRAGAPPCGRGG